MGNKLIKLTNKPETDSLKEEYVYATIPPRPVETITQGRKTNRLVTGINNYFGELKYKLNNNEVPTGKYTIPAVFLTAATGPALLKSLITNPIGFAKAFGLSIAGGEGVNAGSKMLTGKTWGENISELTGLDQDVADYTNVGYLLGPKMGKIIKNGFSKAINRPKAWEILPDGTEKRIPVEKVPYKPTEVQIFKPQVNTTEIAPNIRNTYFSGIVTPALEGKIFGSTKLLEKPKVNFAKDKYGLYEDRYLENMYETLSRITNYQSEGQLRESMNQMLKTPESSLYGLSVEDVFPQLRTGMTLKEISALDKLSRPSISSPNNNWHKRLVKDLFGESNPTNNPLIKQVDPSISKNITLSPAEQDFVDGLVIKNWDPNKTSRFVDLYDSKLNPENLFGKNLHNIRANINNSKSFNIPEPYQHFNPEVYNSKVPLQYYQGYQVPDYVPNIDRVMGGFPARPNTPNNVGLLTTSDVQALMGKPNMIKRLLERSVNVEGSVGTENARKTPLEFARAQAEGINDGITGDNMLQRLKTANVSGYIVEPHSLSTDSEPLWENFILRALRDKRAEVINNSEFVTNDFGRNSRYVIDDNLKTWLRQNKHVPDEHLKTNITNNPDGSQLHTVIYTNPENNLSTTLGNIQVLSPKQMLDRFNLRRKGMYEKMFKTNVDQYYPGDATLIDDGYQLRIPYPRIIIKKQGGKLIPRKK